MQCFGRLDASAFPITRPDGTLVAEIPAGAFVLVTAQDVSGKTALSFPSGDLLSVQPNGAVQTRPAGQIGAWELGVIDGGVISYTPDPSTGHAWVFGLKHA